MPRGDRTGPWGEGPMTGRGLGFCAGNDVPGFSYPARGGGWGRGFSRGAGRGWRHWYYATGMPGWMRVGYAPPTAEDEIAHLKAEADQLNKNLAAIQKRIDQLEEK